MSTDSYVFLGPTISKQEAEQWLQATYLPPISQGDIVSLLGKKPKVIGIIDGYFERVPAVWHKEILLAISDGVHVVGGASMGALRAAELYRFGMVGVGEIFTWYRDGLIEADDEVAVRHMPAEHGYRPTTEALANIRKTLQVACEQAVISSHTARELVEIGRRTHYGRRTYPFLLQQAMQSGLPRKELAALETFVAEQAIDLKKRDAVKVLQQLAQLKKRTQPLDVDYDLNVTHMLVKLVDKDFCLAHINGIRLTADMLVNHARLERDDFLALQERALCHARLLALCQGRGVCVSDKEYRETIDHLRCKFDLEDETDLADWMARNHLSPTEFEIFANEWACIRKMSGRQEDDRPDGARERAAVGRSPSTYPANQHIIRKLRIEGAYEKLALSAVAKEKYFQEKVRDASLWIDEAQLYRQYFRQKQIEPPQDIGLYAAHLGFGDRDVFRVELLKTHCYRQHRRQVLSEWFERLEEQETGSAERHA